MRAVAAQSGVGAVLFFCLTMILWIFGGPATGLFALAAFLAIGSALVWLFIGLPLQLALPRKVPREMEWLEQEQTRNVLQEIDRAVGPAERPEDHTARAQTEALDVPVDRQPMNTRLAGDVKPDRTPHSATHTGYVHFAAGDVDVFAQVLRREFRRDSPRSEAEEVRSAVTAVPSAQSLVPQGVNKLTPA
jgi:hypothetical protein